QAPLGRHRLAVHARAITTVQIGDIEHAVAAGDVGMPTRDREIVEHEPDVRPSTNRQAIGRYPILNPIGQQQYGLRGGRARRVRHAYWPPRPPGCRDGCPERKSAGYDTVPS